MRKWRNALHRFARRFIADEEGVIAIEFAAVAMLLVTMLIGATDLGFAARHRSQMEGAVRAGIQEAIKGGTEAAVEAAVLAATDLPSSPTPTVNVTTVCYDADGATADCEAANVTIYMQIELEQEHTWILGMPGFSNPSILTITNQVRIG